MDVIAVSSSTDERTLLYDNSQGTTAEDLPTKTQFEQLLEMCNVDSTLCENHAAEMLEKNIVCKNCLQPICALCLHQYHMGHSIISLVKLRGMTKIKETLDKDVIALAEKQKFYKDEAVIRDEKIVKIENEVNEIMSVATQRFDQLVSVIEGKRKDVFAHVLNFKKEQLDIINNEMIQINEQQARIQEFNEKMEAFYHSIEVRDAEQLHQMSAEILSKAVNYSVGRHGADDRWRPHKKYSKLPSSIQAVANICRTIRPEVTTGVWLKVESKKKERCDGAVEQPGKRCRIEPEPPMMPQGSDQHPESPMIPQSTDQQTSLTISDKHSTPPRLLAKVLRNATESPDSTCLQLDSCEASGGDRQNDDNFDCRVSMLTQ